MRRFFLLPLVLLVSGTLVATGCSDDGSSQDSASSESPRADTTDGAGSESGGSDEPGSLQDEIDSMLDDAQESVTSLLDEADGAIDGVSECVDMSIAFGKLQAAALGGGDGADQAQSAAEDLKALVPEDLGDDIDVIADAVGTISSEGLTNGGTALSTPEYEAAMNELTTYIESECGLS
jgi:hypothetical protein